MEGVQRPLKSTWGRWSTVARVTALKLSLQSLQVMALSHSSHHSLSLRFSGGQGSDPSRRTQSAGTTLSSSNVESVVGGGTGCWKF